jgi:hypothetical protein
MELTVEARRNAEAPHTWPRTASRNDPQECGGLRQGNIALIHSAPTGESGASLPPVVIARSEATKQSILRHSGMVRKHQTRNLEIPASMLRIVPE